MPSSLNILLKSATFGLFCGTDCDLWPPINYPIRTQPELLRAVTTLNNGFSAKLIIIIIATYHIKNSLTPPARLAVECKISDYSLPRLVRSKKARSPFAASEPPHFSGEMAIELGDYAENEAYLVCNDAEPHIRSQNIVFSLEGSRWYVKVTFKGNIITEDVDKTIIQAQKKYLIRRQQLRAFILFIQFDYLPLLEDIVTEVEFGTIPVASRILPLSSTISELPADNGYRQFVNGLLYYQICEDPSRIQYPSFVKDLSVPTTELAKIKIIAKIAPGISKVNIGSDPKKRHYVFKSIEKPFYKPIDTKILQQELQNLKLFRHSTSIVQLLSVVISTNLYHTGKSEDSGLVLRGLFLEYHPLGTLKDALRENRACPGSRRWPVQIARGLQQLHQQNIVHMDLKPSNIVTNTNNDAVTIDISGIAITNGWLAPEMHEVGDPISLPWEARRRNDIWAYRTLLSWKAKLEKDENQARLLREVIEETTKIEPSERVNPYHITARFEQNPTSKSVFLPASCTATPSSILEQNSHSSLQSIWLSCKSTISSQP